MKKDTSNQSIIDLDLHFKNLEPSKIVTEARDYSKPLVTIPEEVSIDFDAILLEWSYRCDKGYPDMNNEADKALLFSIISELLKEEEEVGETPKISTYIEGSLLLHWLFQYGCFRFQVRLL